MANTSLATRFTDENYSTRQEVAKNLGTNLIDPFWNQILSYRKQFEKVLNIQDFSKTNLTLCLCSLIQKKIAEVSECFYNYKEAFNALEKGGMDYNRITNKLILDAIVAMAKANNVTLDNVSATNIMEHKNVDLQFASYERYLGALSLLLQGRNEIDSEFLAKLYVQLTGNPEMIEFYRTSELSSSKIIIGREYTGAPVALIEEQMDDLFAFVHRNDLPLFVKVCITAYVIDAVKPFAQYNREIATLIMKAMVVNEIGEAGIYLPLEKFFSDNQIVIATMAKEVQKTRDVTYIVKEFLNQIDLGIKSCANEIVNSARDQIYQEQEAMAQEILVENNVQPAHQVVVEPEPVVQPVFQPKKEEPKVSLEKEQPKEVVSEKELNSKASELLETDPFLRKAQAHFYVRHCEPGHFYTIEQFRKAEGCVYETARTSMDGLADRGYYRREKVNNKKFVYTPIFK